MKTSICKLCLKTAELVKSHIIPEFLYNEMYDDKHKFFMVSSNPEIKTRTPKKGLWEYLLCRHCDNVVLGRYEDYAAKVLYDGAPMETALDGNNLRFRGLNYATLKLFYLSLLWRMSITTHPFFKEVNLGPHEEKLRQMLIAGIPGDQKVYGTLCIVPLFSGEARGNWMMPPDFIREGNQRVYRCLIAGLLYCFFVSNKPCSSPLAETFLKQDGSWIIMRDRIESINFLHKWCVDLGHAMKKRRAMGSLSTELE